MPKHVGATIPYINEMHGSRDKIPILKISSGSVARRDLIAASQD
jgi:hypothetical protein